MPIYEFKCDSCGKEFERLVFASDNNAETCPDCGSDQTHKVMSVFSSNALERQAASCAGSHGGGGGG
ncbi:MAG: zinc ribbon domain-containing protein [Desulfomonile tiedjei]|uniref:Zinc ribbon domain-containing protein n=1 Tax=Desulfomonile tiedjei TaxID=2358 RepID=A0A9D6Z0Z1_9BACT|nr:zinc ribbon domain-containing protein [Desulfomonile tiedjei]